MTNLDKATGEASFLSIFPKQRLPLPTEYLSIYDSEYLSNRTAGGLANRIGRALESWMHKKVAGSAVNASETILELGAGSLNHLPWEKNYASYDVVEPWKDVLDSSSNLALIRHTYSDIGEVPEKSLYDRVISIAVLEHLLDLPKQIAHSGLHLFDGGKFCAGIPSEGALFWKIAWKYGTGPGFKKRTGLDYEIVMQHEHVNTADEIEKCIRYFFDDVRIQRFPLPAKSLSLYTFIDAARPNKDRCKRFSKIGS
jgi:hypothetical protein